MLHAALVLSASFDEERATPKHDAPRDTELLALSARVWESGGVASFPSFFQAAGCCPVAVCAAVRRQPLPLIE